MRVKRGGAWRDRTFLEYWANLAQFVLMRVRKSVALPRLQKAVVNETASREGAQQCYYHGRSL